MKVKTKIELANKIVEMMDGVEGLNDKERRRVCAYAVKLYTARIKGQPEIKLEEQNEKAEQSQLETESNAQNEETKQVDANGE